MDSVALEPPELEPDQPLRSRLRGGSFAALLPLVHFLRELTSDVDWELPPLRAAFVIDDPNLHALSYGYLRYPEIADHARAHGYHVAIAMSPIDGWLIRPAAAQVFRERPDELSLLIHGNDHRRLELARIPSEQSIRASLAEGLRRVEAIERRSGVSVARVMAAPYEKCSEPAMRAMLELGFEAITITRPYSWSPQPYGDHPLGNWEPAELAAGFPVLPRLSLLKPSRDDLVLRAFLGQPLILYGHHDFAAEGLQSFEREASSLERLGGVAWMSPEGIARTNFAMRREGDVLAIRAFSRRLRVDVPEGVDTLRVELSREDPAQECAVVHRSAPGGPLHRAVRVPLEGRVPVRGPEQLDLHLPSPVSIDHRAVEPPSWRPWPIVRRLLAEGRDRLDPVLGRRMSPALRGRHPLAHHDVSPAQLAVGAGPVRDAPGTRRPTPPLTRD